jgi:hypothetical protein
MSELRILILAAVAGALFVASPSKALAQEVTVDVGIAPECPYGYYDYAPYNCVPDGYYGPEWFKGGAFVGVGPWFHGDDKFQGSVDNRLDPHHGYNGAMPKNGEKASEQRRDPSQFKGNEKRDGRGHGDGDKIGDKH